MVKFSIAVLALAFFRMSEQTEIENKNLRSAIQSQNPVSAQDSNADGKDDFDPKEPRKNKVERPEPQPERKENDKRNTKAPSKRKLVENNEEEQNDEEVVEEEENVNQNTPVKNPRDNKVERPSPQPQPEKNDKDQRPLNNNKNPNKNKNKKNGK